MLEQNDRNAVQRDLSAHRYLLHATPMSAPNAIAPDDIRARFSRAMSEMYRQEVPQYGVLLDLVADVNALALEDSPALKSKLARSGELDRLEVERHGAIRLGTATELATMRRIFAVMGMSPVGYYDLSVAGVPVHSTAFRPISDEALLHNPFRAFTSLLRLELVDDPELRAEAARILSQRNIFIDRVLELVDQFERGDGFTSREADEFVAEVREIFRWKTEAAVSEDVYHRLHEAHRLIADVVSFKGPHINHLTPRTLDIDAAQREMTKRGIVAKDVIEGPPPRRHPILLRQTSFKALKEEVAFADDRGQVSGTHTARFGEIEQRGMALTRKGRALYDELLATVREPDGAGGSGQDYAARLQRVFEAFPDDLTVIRERGLAFFRYTLTEAGRAAANALTDPFELDQCIADGHVAADPLVYEDFLPVSAAGIFQSNLGGAEQKSYHANSARRVFETALGAEVIDEFDLYEATERRSIDALRAQLQVAAAR